MPPPISKWATEFRRQIRPVFFSKPVQRIMGEGNRVASRFLFEKAAKDRLRSLFARLPFEYSARAISNLDAYFEACLEGRGVGPSSYYEISKWLGNGLENILNPPEAAQAPLISPRSEPAKKLKILFVAGSYPSQFHGGGLRLLDLLDLLAEKHEVSLYCIHNEAHDGPADLAQWKALKALKVVNDDETFVAEFGSWIKTRAPFDAVHFYWPRSTELMRQARPFARRLIFEYVEGMTRNFTLFLDREIQRQEPPSAKTIYQLLASFRQETIASALADDTISLIPQDAAFASHVFGGGPGKVIPTGLSERFLWKQLDPDLPAPRNQDALFLGFFGHTPNLESLKWYVTEVHPRVCRRLPDYRLVISGRGEAAAVKALLEGQPQVHYRGEFADLAAEIASARIGVAPLVAGSGLRGKVNQYSAVGRPTVSTSIGVAGLPYEANESIMIADSPGEFAQRVIRLLEDEVLYESMRMKARAVAEKNFRWKAYLEALEAIYVG